jgi:murein DD-endopeptidase MepM/ murein hydrolase activator NlpD
LCAQPSGGDTIQTRYAHLSRSCVEEGEYVEQGQLIGYSGDSGAEGQPHLHFEIRRIIEGTGVREGSSEALDPLPYLQQHGGANPLDVMFVTSPFSPARTIGGVTRPHRGVDLRARTPLPVYAAFSGRVMVNQWVRGYGNALYINH